MENQNDQGDIWEVFVQSKSGLPHKHVGSVHAYDKKMAIENARDLYTRRKEAVGLWVVKAEDIVAVAAEDAESFYDSADDKIYRHPSFYEIPDGVTHI